MESFKIDQILNGINDSDIIDLVGRMQSEVDTIEEYHGALIVTKKFSSLAELNEGWEDVQHLIAAGLQENLSKVGLMDFVGEIYLILMIQESVPVEVRQLIERDKYCCKKYVVDNTLADDSFLDISERLPLFCKWDFSGSDSSFSIGINEERIKERLTKGLDSCVAKVLCETHGFEKMTTGSLINKILSKEIAK